MSEVDTMRVDLMSGATSRYISEIKPLPNMGGGQIRYEFPNGYGASVVRHRYSYGGDAGLFELAVTVGRHLVYDTPVTGDVLGHLTPADVDHALLQIKNLPPLAGEA